MFQCLLYCPASGSSRRDILLAASGSYIVSFDVQTGSPLSTWPSTLENALERSATGDSNGQTSGRPAKRQKTMLPQDVSSSDSAEIVVEKANNLDIFAGSTQASTSYVAKLARTVDGKNIIAVTAEDKCIRVFNLFDNGSIKQVSERPMPKRPCAIALSPDNTTILCGDKFGDVYYLPLLGTSYETRSADSKQSPLNVNGEASEPRSKPFSPAATSLTVHTKKNREALRNQQRQAKQKSEKDILKFDHKLLLGHVSLLTDLISVHLSGRYSPSGKARDYIITADRDEHIRVSRGIPQSHIIEGYCLGHMDFVSKICVPEQHAQLLLSGGGDGCLLVWDWLSGRLTQKVDLRQHVIRMRASKAVEEEDDLNIAISGILDIGPSKCNARSADVAVICEAVPALFLFSFNSQTELEWYDSVETTSNVIDVVVTNDRTNLLYSLDNTHKGFTTASVLSEDVISTRPCIGAYNLASASDDQANGKAETITVVSAMDKWAKEDARLTSKGKNSWLYSLETLRKKTQED